MNKERIRLIDELRGIALILMVVYHFLYSLMFVFGITLKSWVLDTMMALQPFGAGLFILIAGISSCLSHNNSRRGLQALMVAMLISMVTRLIMPSQTIYFGVLHFYSVAILTFAASRRLLERIPPALLAIGSGALFYLTRHLAEGFLTLPLVGRLALPEGLYTSVLLAPLGLPPGSFTSADYFPLLPWLPLFLVGTAVGRVALANRLPAFFYESHAPVLSRLGQHSLLIYVVHQPVILAFLWLATSLI